MKLFHFFLFLFFSLSLMGKSVSASASGSLDIVIPEGKFQVDESLKIIVSQIEKIEDYNDLSTFDAIHFMLANARYELMEAVTELKYSESYMLSIEGQTYRLFFTQLPIITIDSNTEILNEPKTVANFTYTDEAQTVNSLMGIELRGGFSRTFPKLTYDLEFWEDELGENSQNQQFGKLRKDDDWILDAIYNEPLRIRSFISHKLWLDLHQVYYLEDEPKAKSGADVMYVEMFLNGKYNGVYFLSEQVDKKQLQIKSYKDEEIRGELYKGEDVGATRFLSLPDFDNESRKWGGFEMKYPDEDEITDWNNIYDFVDLVINSRVEDFGTQVWGKFHKENAMDYFLFLNLLSAADNTGKNIYVGKYTIDEPYFYVPWDLDGTLGNQWDGSPAPWVSGIYTNGFFSRLLEDNPEDYKQQLREKWMGYRNNIFSKDSLAARVNESYNFLKDNNVYEREKLVFPNYVFNDSSRVYTLEWIRDRLEYLDNEFGIILPTENINVDQSNFTLFPNPTQEALFIELKDQREVLPYKIFDVSGKIIRHGHLDGSILLDVSDLSRGMYFVQVENVTRKLVRN